MGGGTVTGGSVVHDVEVDGTGASEVVEGTTAAVVEVVGLAVVDVVVEVVRFGAAVDDGCRSAATSSSPEPPPQEATINAATTRVVNLKRLAIRRI